MYAKFVSHFPWLNLVVIGEVMFLMLFIAALLWVFRKNSTQFYEKLAQLPLEEGASHERS